MIGDSFWSPTRPKRVVLLVAVLGMVVLHQSELFGLMDSELLLLGWLPAQIAYDVLYLLVGVVILYAMYLMAPQPPAEYDQKVDQNSRESRDDRRRGDG